MKSKKQDSIYDPETKRKLQEMAAATLITKDKRAKEAAIMLAKELAWKRTHRKGETMPDFNDQRSSLEKRYKKKTPWQERLRLNIFKSERKKVIEEKIKHYEETGNQRKLAIYKSKL